jgi:hypothetical protein
MAQRAWRAGADHPLICPGKCNGCAKVKTTTWHETNRERRRSFQSDKACAVRGADTSLR